MGAGPSSSSVLASHEQLLARLAGPEAIEYSDIFWSQLFSYGSALTAMDPASVEEALAPYCRQLLVHNPLTHNFQKLFIHTLDLLSASAAQQHSGMMAANSVRMLATLLKYTAETAAPSTLSSIFVATQGLPSMAQGMDSLMPMFVNRLIGVVCNCNPNHSAESYVVILEVLQLLLVCCSTQLYTQTTAAPPDSHPFLDAMVQQPAAAVPFMTALLQLIVARAAPPPGAALYVPQQQGSGRSVTRMVRTAAATMFWIPMRTAQFIWRVGGGGSSNSGDAAGGSPVGDAALLLLLVLVHYPAQHAHHVNTFKAALQALQDSAAGADAEAGRTSSSANSNSSSPIVSFSALFDYFCAAASSEAATLLLYTLLLGSKSFSEYVLVRSDVEALLVPLLKQLYSASLPRNANHMYMLQIIILILGQDTSFCHNIHKIALPGGAPWYKERLLNNKMTLGSLIFIVLLRSALHSFSRLSDLYLPTNTLAALANLAPQAANLHAHAAQRLVGLAATLGRRYLKTERLSREQAVLSGQGVPPRLQEELTVLSDFLRIVLEIINAILQVGLQRNPELVYALLHKQDAFTPLKAHPRLTELVDNIQVVVDFFTFRLDSAKPEVPHAQGDWSVARVLELVQSYSQGWRSDRLRHFPDLKFCYEEEAAPEEFFVPYIWALCSDQRRGIAWNPDAIALLTPLAAVELGDYLEGAGSGDQTPSWAVHDAASRRGSAA